MRIRGITPTQAAFWLTAVAAVVLLIARLISVRDLFFAVDWRIVGLLGAFMLLAEGLKSTRFVDWLAGVMARRARGPGGVYLPTLMSTFILAMLVTNDAALFTVVPFTLALAQQKRINLRRLIIYEIMAVNLGSAFTPWGNPQNLFIYHHFQLSPLTFFRESAPFAFVSLAALVLLALINARLTEKNVALPHKGNSYELPIHWKKSGILLGIFILLVLSVVQIVPVPLSIGIIVLYMATMERIAFIKLDWWLLGTFFLLFPTMNGLGELLARSLGGLINNPLGVYGAGIGISQVIGNVPVVMLLSHATADWRSLFYGVNLGGLGTVVASFANLIGLSLYLNGVPHDSWWRFILESLGWNIVTMIILGGIFLLFVG